ncbi:hypothetical protein V5799_020415 [Amblyomma americanum]|uniref:Uncharacterized protein n=1 Tax=Amblyomma americanum TaxID=6943 RepID=A0AAQ4ETW5_AMBAM
MSEDPNNAAGDATDTSALDKDDKMSETSANIRQSLLSLKRHVRKTYGPRPMKLVSRYFRYISNLAVHADNAAFLKLCRRMGVTAPPYRVECRGIKNADHVVRILQSVSYWLMMDDDKCVRKRRVRASRLLDRLYAKLEKIMSVEDMINMVILATERYENILEATRNKHRAMLLDLLEKYGYGYGIEQKDSGESED